MPESGRSGAGAVRAVAEQNLQVAREGQITDRFTKAADLLGAQKDRTTGVDPLARRLGGIYALERIACDSTREYWPAMDVLAGLNLTGHFLDRCVFAPEGRALPQARARLFDGIERSSISRDHG